MKKYCIEESRRETFYVQKYEGRLTGLAISCEGTLF
jgi:hypothetical protein